MIKVEDSFTGGTVLFVKCFFKYGDFCKNSDRSVYCEPRLSLVVLSVESFEFPPLIWREIGGPCWVSLGVDVSDLTFIDVCVLNLRIRVFL